MQLLTSAETASRLGLGVSTVKRMIQRGELPVVRFGTAVRVPDESLDAWIRSRVEGDVELVADPRFRVRRIREA